MEVAVKSDIARKLLPLANAYATRKNCAVERELGSGGSASVFLLQGEGPATALKVYDPRFLDEQNGPAERRRIDLQRKLIGHTCPTLVKILDIALEQSTCFIEMEYVDWSNLKDVVAVIPDSCVEDLFAQLLDAVLFLADQGLVHRDIKPENIMVDNQFKQLKLIDLGVMREAGDGEDSVDATDHGLRRPFIASAQYSSPEYLFRLKEPSERMWMALTIYQIGGVLHDLVTKRPLFDDLVKTENKFALAMAVLSNVPNLADVHGSMLQWAAVASNCLVKDPDLRVALVDLRRIKPGGKTGRQRLQEMTERQKVLREAKDAKEQQENELLQLRTSALDALQGIVKQRLIELIDKTYGVVAYVNQDASVVFEVAIDSRIKLHMHFSFGWLGAFTPLVAKAELVAWLGSAPDVGSLKRRAVGQFAAESKIDEVFATAMLEAISEVVVVASEHVDLSTSFDATSSIVDAIFLLLNEQPLR